MLGLKIIDSLNTMKKKLWKFFYLKIVVQVQQIGPTSSVIWNPVIILASA